MSWVDLEWDDQGKSDGVAFQQRLAGGEAVSHVGTWKRSVPLGETRKGKVGSGKEPGAQRGGTGWEPQRTGARSHSF